MTCVGWCGLCYANRRGRASYKGHRFVSSGAVALRRLPMGVKKRERPEAGRGGQANGVDCNVLSGLPTLLSYLTDDKYEDGSPRQRSTLTLFIEEGMVKLALNDRQEHASLYLAAEGLGTALEALESKLEAGTGDWRAWNNRTRKAGK